MNEHADSTQATSPLYRLETHTDFVGRHVGPSKEDVQTMLDDPDISKPSSSGSSLTEMIVSQVVPAFAASMSP